MMSLLSSFKEKVMAKREFVMLAHKYNAKKHSASGCYMSEKMDGQRFFWDGGITRDMLKADVPWANCAKDSRYVTPPYATGLWSRYGNVIHASDDFLDALPPVPLDGELFHDEGRQRLRKVVARLTPDDFDWVGVRALVFDSPHLPEDGEIKTTNFKKVITGCEEFINGRRQPRRCFHDTYTWLQEYLMAYPRVELLEQVRLPMQTVEAEKIALRALDDVTTAGGEGIMLREAYSFWTPERSHNLTKIKKLEDAEGTVVGYTTGRRTALGSKLLGMMGALILDIGGKRLELSGFTEAERTLGMINPNKMVEDGASEWATDHPEQELPAIYHAIHFPRDSKVTFRFRGKSDDGIPNEARYWRKYEAV